MLNNWTQCSKLLLLFWEAQEDSGDQKVTKLVILSSVYFLPQFPEVYLVVITILIFLATF